MPGAGSPHHGVGGIRVKALLELIVKALVDHPQDVTINQVEGAESLIIEVRVNPDDMGKVIGKQGRIIRAIRTLVKATAAREGKRVLVEVLQ